MLGITYDMAFSAILLPHSLAFSAHGKASFFSSSYVYYYHLQHHHLGCRREEKGSEAFHGRRISVATLSPTFGSSCTLINHKDALNRLAFSDFRAGSKWLCCLQDAGSDLHNKVGGLLPYFRYLRSLPKSRGHCTCLACRWPWKDKGKIV